MDVIRGSGNGSAPAAGPTGALRLRPPRIREIIKFESGVFLFFPS